MKWLTHIHPDPAIYLRIVWALAHFLWQGTFVAAIVWMAEPWLNGRSARLRYKVYFVSLLMLAMLPVINFMLLSRAQIPARETTAPVVANLNQSKLAAPVGTESDQRTTEIQSVSIPQADLSPATSSESPLNRLTRAAPWAVAAYGAGVLLMLVRLGLAVLAGRSLCRSAISPDARMLEIFERIALRMRMKAVPTLGFCTRLATPSVVGIFGSMVLFPVSVASELSVSQLEAILAHELAHIRRWDVIANIVQRIIKAFLFFHPAVWFLSNRIRVERENCCDDLVLALGAEKSDYADALVRVAQLAFTPSASLAGLAATGSRSRLRRRILRIMGNNGHYSTVLPRGGLAFVAVLLLLALSAIQINAPALRAHGQAQLKPASTLPASMPISQNITLQESDAARPIRMSKGDNLIVTLEEVKSVNQWIWRDAANEGFTLIEQNITPRPGSNLQAHQFRFIVTGATKGKLALQLRMLAHATTRPLIDMPTDAQIDAEQLRLEVMILARAPRNEATGEILFKDAVNAEIARRYVQLPALMRANVREKNRQYLKSVQRIVVFEIDSDPNDATARGLKWLSNHVGPDGTVSSASKGNDSGVAIPSFAGLAFLAAGSSTENGPYAKQLKEITQYVISQQQPSGLLQAKTPSGPPMYEHGYALLFLAESYMKHPDASVRQAMTKAIALTEKNANPQGGWRYTPQPLDADISVTACQLNALLAAKAAGLEVNPNIVAKAIEYVRSCQNPDGGFSYMARQQGGGSSGWPRSAAAVAVLIHGDTRLVDDALVRGIRYASETAMAPRTHYFYGMYYTSQWITAAARDAKTAEAMKTAILSAQCPDGSWTGEISDEYATANALLVLQSRDARLWIFR
ncbi:MAG TPA: M56 family metallopeptidase [Tepidisphaeraceae bacterium]|jgi:beta-lactamase regulating signal transducer with metallopeptidase domain